MMIFQFRILSDEVEDFLLDVEVPYDMNMLDFHELLLHDLGYNPCEIASFFLSDVEWEKLQEFTLIDMGTTPSDFKYEVCEECHPPIPMKNVTLGEVVRAKFDRMVYVFDQFTERQLYIELLRSLPSDPERTYPRIVDRQGVAPKQFLDE